MVDGPGPGLELEAAARRCLPAVLAWQSGSGVGRSLCTAAVLLPVPEVRPAGPELV